MSVFHKHSTYVSCDMVRGVEQSLIIGPLVPKKLGLAPLIWSGLDHK